MLGIDTLSAAPLPPPHYRYVPLFYLFISTACGCLTSHLKSEHQRRLIVNPFAFPSYPFPEVGRYRLSTT